MRSAQQQAQREAGIKKLNELYRKAEEKDVSAITPPSQALGLDPHRGEIA